MFWEIMTHIGRHYLYDGGFALWLESDMALVKARWIDLLAEEWCKQPSLLTMGLYIPSGYFPGLRAFVPAHINGGACYSKDFVNHVPAEANSDAFDMALWPALVKTGRYQQSRSFSFTTIGSRIRILNALFSQRPPAPPGTTPRAREAVWQAASRSLSSPRSEDRFKRLGLLLQ
jgi:hypothetical protein